MAYTKTINVDQLFVRDIYFKDFGNRPISSGQFLITRGDGGIFFSNTSTNGIKSFTSIVPDGTSTTIYPTTIGSNALYLGAGPGINYTVSGTPSTVQKLYINNLGIQQLGIVDTRDVIRFSNLPVPTPAGRTIFFQGVGETTLQTSNVNNSTIVYFNTAFSSSYSSIQELLSTIYVIEENVSTTIIQLSTLIGQASSIQISSIFSTLTGVQETDAYLSTFLFTTFVDDGEGNHNQLKTSTITTNSLSTTNLSTSVAYTKDLYVGSNYIYESSLHTSNNYCTTYVADGPLNAVVNSLNIEDEVTNVGFAFVKTAFTNQSTFSGSTIYTKANQTQYGLRQAFSNADLINPVVQQIEAIKYYIDEFSTQILTAYDLKNTLIADEICAPSTLKIFTESDVIFSTPTVIGNALEFQNILTSNVIAQNASWVNAYGESSVLSTLCVSTIVGVAAPILTFDKDNYRIGVNLGSEMPQATVDVSGVIIANNFVTLSDRRLKTNIRPLQLKSMISSYSYTMEGFEDIGVIADEIEAIAPMCVYTRPDGYKAVSYPKLVPVLLSYIHDLSTRLSALESNVPVGV